LDNIGQLPSAWLSPHLNLMSTPHPFAPQTAPKQPAIQPCHDPVVVRWSQILLDSFEHYLKKPLLTRSGDAQQDAHTLFTAPFVVVSHNGAADPILNYGNQAALDLWQLDWSRLIQIPSRLTAEPTHRDERARMLEAAAAQGYIENYSGIRIASTGQRFRIDSAVVWNLDTETAQPCGQAASFSAWTFLDG
jgi:hypothetical protein